MEETLFLWEVTYKDYVNVFIGYDNKYSEIDVRHRKFNYQIVDQTYYCQAYNLREVINNFSNEKKSFAAESVSVKRLSDVEKIVNVIGIKGAGKNE